MKKCPFCGKEYPDHVVRCLVDNELLAGGEALPGTDTATMAIPPMPPPPLPAFVSALPPSTGRWTERQIRFFELALVCLVAFGGFILSSAYSYFYGSPNRAVSGSGTYSWVYNSLREVTALGLLWYVLLRRGKSFASLGLSWQWTDLPWSIALRGATTAAYFAVYNAIFYSGLTAVSSGSASAHVGSLLFAGGISVVTLLFQCLNPFFEELIARAYVMTEIRQLTGSVTAAVIISTVIQTSYHFYQGAPAALAHGASFLVLSIYYAKTNRIAPVILAHLYSDVGGTLWYMSRHY